jgi:hypothetical protein
MTGNTVVSSVTLEVWGRDLKVARWIMKAINDCVKIFISLSL